MEHGTGRDMGQKFFFAAALYWAGGNAACGPRTAPPLRDIFVGVIVEVQNIDVNPLSDNHYSNDVQIIAKFSLGIVSSEDTWNARNCIVAGTWKFQIILIPS